MWFLEENSHERSFYKYSNCLTRVKKNKNSQYFVLHFGIGWKQKRPKKTWDIICELVNHSKV